MVRSRPEPVVEVSSRPEDVAAARARPPAAPSAAIPADRWLDRLESTPLPLELPAMLAEAPAGTLDRLRGLAAPTAPPGARANAAALLHAIGDESAEPTLRDVLSAAGEPLLLALGELVRNNRLAAPLLRTPLVAARLRELGERTEDPMCRARVLQIDARLAGWDLLPAGAAAAFLHAARLATTEDADRLVSEVVCLLETGSANAPGAALALLEHIEATGASGWRAAYWLRSAALHAGPAGLPLLDRLGGHADRMMAGAALVGLARLRGPSTRVLLFAALDAPDTRLAAIEAVGLAFRGTADREAVARLSLAAIADRGAHAGAAARALLEVAGRLAMATLVGLRGRADSDTQQEVLWRSFGVTLDDAFAAALEAGLLADVPHDSERARYRARSPTRLDAAVFWQAVLERGAAMRGAHRSDPPRHDDLLRVAATATRGVLVLENVVEEPVPDATRGQIGSMLSFVCGERAYRVGCRDLFKDHDQEAVLAAAHRAVADLGRPERFLGARTGAEQLFLFGEPDRLRRFCTRVHVLLGWDLEDVRRERAALKERWASGLP